MKLGVVIVTYNRIDLLKETINACLNQTYKFDKIIIVDNASNDGTAEYLLKKENKKFSVINTGENLGGAGGFYTGLREFANSDFDYVLLIDDDAIIDKNYNKNIIDHMNSSISDNIVAFSGSVITDEKIQFDHRQFLPKIRRFKVVNSKFVNYENEYFDYDLSTFCGLFVPVSLISKIGLPRKEFFIWFDDTEYSLRLIKYGKIRNINSSFLIHKTNIVQNRGYSWKSYYGLRNNLIILKENYKKTELIIFIFKMIIRIFGGKLLFLIKKDNYYNNVSNLYKDALKDGLCNNLGKKEKYVPKFKIKGDD